MNYFRSKLLLCLLLFYVSFVHASTVIVTNALSSSVNIYNENALDKPIVVKVDNMPHEIALTKDGKTALVSNFGDIFNCFPGNTISVIDVANAKLSKTITLVAKSRPHGMAFINDKIVLVTVQGIQSLLVLDYVADTVLSTIALPGSGAHLVKVDSKQQYAYIGNRESGEVIKVNLNTQSVAGMVKIGKAAVGLALTKDDQKLFVTNDSDNTVAVINPTDMSIIKIIKTDRGAMRISLFDNDKFAAVANTTGGTVQIIDTVTLEIINSFRPTSHHDFMPGPTNIFVNEDQTTAYVTDILINKVALMDLKTGKVLKMFSSKFMPDDVARSPV